MPASGVQVATTALLREWRRTDYTDLWVRFSPQRGRDVEAEVSEAVEAAIGLMTAVPEATDVAFVQYANGIYSAWTGIRISRPQLVGIEDYHFRYNLDLRPLFVPDARGAMVLTDAHLGRARDLTDWSVESLGHGRHLVQARDLAAWFAQPEPAPDVLAKARADFGPMILTRADVDRQAP